MKKDKIYSSLEEALERPEQVYKLDLRFKFASIPESITSLTNLTELDLSHNWITIIPEFIGSLNKLKKLNLKGNQISGAESY